MRRVVVWVKTLHRDYGRKEGSMGFRRANYRATSDVYNTGAYPPAVLCSFLLYATFVSSYSTLRKPTFFLRAIPSRRCGPMPIVLRIYLRPSSFRLVAVYRPENSSLRFIFVVRLSFDRCLLILCFQRQPVHLVLVAEPWGLSLESLQGDYIEPLSSATDE